MAKLFVLLFLYFEIVYSESQIETNVANDMMSKDTNSVSMLETSMSKIKRHSWPILTTPCPPYWPQNKIWQITQKPKVQFVQQPTYYEKPTFQLGWQPSNPWQKNSYWKSNQWPMQSNPWATSGSGWSKPSNSWPVPSIGWSKSASGWQASNWQTPGWQPKVIVQKPANTYIPQYQKPLYNEVPKYQHNLIKPATDCPPFQHHHQHQTGIIYAPQHQYPIQSNIKYNHHEPQYVKVVKPVYHAPPPTYLPPPSYHRPHIPHTEICDK